MTQQASFKKRVRARMAKTGERYVAARRQLIEQADRRAADGDAPTGETTSRTWVAAPEIGDDAVRDATGRSWDEWCDVLDAWPGKDDGHSAIAAHLVEEHEVPGWWAQTVTVGYERITGRRLPHQRPDGTFSAGRSATITVDPAQLRELLLDDAAREDLFPHLTTELRSRPTSKNVRLAVGDGVAEFNLEPRDDGRVKVTVAHEKLPRFEDVATWKAYWGEWLRSLDEA